MVECRLCKKCMKRVTSSHLKKHEISTNEYLRLFPDAELFSDELRHAYGKHARENNPMHNPISVDKVRIKLKDRPKSEQHKKNLSAAKTGKSWGRHTDEHKENMKVISKNNMNIRLASGWRPPKWTEQRKVERSEFMHGNKLGMNGHHNKNKKLNLSPEQRTERSKKRVDFLKTNVTPKTNTSIELLFIEYCNDNNIEFVHQFPIHTDNGSWLYDFLLPNLNLLVEVDGEYWHSTAKQINRDVIKNNIAKKNGYTLLRLSDKNLEFGMIFNSTNFIKNHTDLIMNNRINQLKKSSGNDLP